MKKIILATALTLISFASFSQKKKVNEANDYITKAQNAMNIQNTQVALENLKLAQTAIDAAITDPSTSEKYKTWFSRAIVYSLLLELEPQNLPNNLKAAKESVLKSYQLDKKKTLKENNVELIITNIGFQYFNSGVNYFNESKFAEALTELNHSYEMLNIDEGNFFPKNSLQDTIKYRVLYLGGLSAYYAGDMNTAISKLQMALTSPVIAPESNAYVILSNAYGKTGNKQKQIETINLGKSTIKGDQNLATAEINYYIESGELNVVQKKITEELTNDPNRDDLYFHLGLIDIELTKKLDQSNKNEEEELKLYNNAIKNFSKAYSIKKDFKYELMLGFVNFNAGAIYNNRLSEIIDEKKQQEIIKERDVYFDQAKIYYTKIHEMYSSKDKSKLSNSELANWQQALTALKDISVARQNTEEYKKYSEMLQKL